MTPRPQQRYPRPRSKGFRLSSGACLSSVSNSGPSGRQGNACSYGAIKSLGLPWKPFFTVRFDKTNRHGQGRHRYRKIFNHIFGPRYQRVKTVSGPFFWTDKRPCLMRGGNQKKWSTLEKENNSEAVWDLFWHRRDRPWDWEISGGSPTLPVKMAGPPSSSSTS